MATYTPNYGLHQWVPEDNFLRLDFNEDFQKIDTALAEKAEKGATGSSLADIESSMNSEFESINSVLETLENRTDVVIGNYKGTGTGRSFYIGFTPQAILVEHQSGMRVDGSSVYGGLFSASAPLTYESNLFAEIIEGGFVLYSINYYGQLNRNGDRYTYIAFR